MHATFWLKWSSVLIGAGMWYQTNPVSDLHYVYTQGLFANWFKYQKPASEKWSRFMAPVSGACVMGISLIDV